MDKNELLGNPYIRMGKLIKKAKQNKPLKDKVIHIRCSEADLNALTKAAESVGSTLSQWILHTVLKGIK